MLKVGIIGAGLIAEHHEHFLNQVEDLQITAVCDIRKDAAEAMAGRHGAVALENYQDLLETDVDIVYICTPPDSHKDITIAAAEAKKHIFLEKPIALSYEDGLAMQEAINKAGVKCQVGYVLGYRPGDDLARRLFKEGTLGPLVSVYDRRMSYAAWLNDCLDTHRDWLTDKERSGGVLIECMTHEVGWLISVGGEVEAVYANLQYANPNPRITVDDNCWAILHFKSGGVGALGTSWTNPLGSGEKAILGVNGAVRVAGDNVVMVKHGEESKEMKGVPDVPISKQADFARAVRENLPCRNPFDEALYNLKVMLAMHKSHLTRQVVQIDE